MITVDNWVLYFLLAVACTCGVVVRIMHYRLVAHRTVMLVVILKNACQAGAYGRIAYNLYDTPGPIDKIVLLCWMMYLLLYITNIALNLLDVRTVWNRQND